MSDVLYFPRRDEVRELKEYLDKRFDRLEAILCGEPLDPQKPDPNSAIRPSYSVLPYEPRRSERTNTLR